MTGTMKRAKAIPNSDPESESTRLSVCGQVTSCLLTSSSGMGRTRLGGWCSSRGFGNNPPRKKDELVGESKLSLL